MLHINSTMVASEQSDCLQIFKMQVAFFFPRKYFKPVSFMWNLTTLLKKKTYLT